MFPPEPWCWRRGASSIRPPLGCWPRSGSPTFLSYAGREWPCSQREDEVQTPGETLQPGRLFDSNTYGTAAALRRWGAEPVLLGIARDNLDDLRAKITAGAGR